jgi:hypothetical protein
MGPTHLDIAVASTLARSVRDFKASKDRSASGVEFERAIYDAVFKLHRWRHAASPDQFNMNLSITSRTGVPYEFDGVFATSETLYVIEAKHLAGQQLTREHVGIFVQKLLDTLLGSQDEIGHLVIKPIIVSALPKVDVAARRHAMAWGILLLTPIDSTPLEILGALSDRRGFDAALDFLASECAELAVRTWRPFNDILCPPTDHTHIFALHADRIRDANQVSQLLEQCNECWTSAESLGVMTPQGGPQTA